MVPWKFAVPCESTESVLLTVGWKQNNLVAVMFFTSLQFHSLEVEAYLPLSSLLLTPLVTLENRDRDHRSEILKGLLLLLSYYWEAD